MRKILRGIPEFAFLPDTLDELGLPELTEIILRYVFGVPRDYIIHSSLDSDSGPVKLDLDVGNVRITIKNYTFSQWICRDCGLSYSEWLHSKEGVLNRSRKCCCERFAETEANDWSRGEKFQKRLEEMWGET